MAHLLLSHEIRNIIQSCIGKYYLNSQAFITFNPLAHQVITYCFYFTRNLEENRINRSVAHLNAKRNT